MPSKPVHALRFKALKPFVSFKMSKNPTDYEKRKIKLYYDRLVAVKGQRFASKYRPKNQKRLKAALNYAQQKGKQWKVAFIPTTYGGKPKLVFDSKGRLSVKDEGEHVSRRIWQFRDFEEFKGQTATDPASVAARILKKDKTSKQFCMLCAEFESNSWYDRDMLASEMGRMFSQKQGIGSGATLEWFTGVAGYAFKRQKSFEQYKLKRQLTKANKRKRKKRKAFKDKSDL